MSTAAQTITNISCYLFAPLQDLKNLREQLQTRCKELALKGTILLSTEGINLFIAGDRESVDAMVAEIRSVPGLEKLTPKYSQNDYQPFNRMLVRVKKEIIAFGVDGIQPAEYTSPRIKPVELKQWLDEGRPVLLLDTRNDYEVKLGTFSKAHEIGIQHFRDFPDAVRQLPAEMKQMPVVTFCTGGIRCEKAAPFLEREGFQQVWQLEGGILKYFEEVGGDHWQGECFVFDQRVGVDPALEETGSAQCYVCQAPLTEAEQQDQRFIAGISCPYCFKTTDEQRAASIAQRHQALQQFTTPLPGSTAQDNLRPLSISQRCDGLSLIDALGLLFTHVPRADWLQVLANRRLLDQNQQPADPQQIVRNGQRFYHLQPAEIEPEVRVDIRLLHEDEALLVLEKPAPLPMHPCGRYHRNTLQHILHHIYDPQKPRPCHRLDANTTGLVILARTRHFAKLVQRQFTEGRVEKVYLTRVHGHPPTDRFRCDAPIRSEPAQFGAREVDAEAGEEAITDFRVLTREPAGTTLLEARPITGRTNQIRLHLWLLGHPILNDPTYLPNQQRGQIQTLSVQDTPMHLHAHQLTFTHPLTGEPVHFTSTPEWL
jgi:UPF0176 protein